MDSITPPVDSSAPPTDSPDAIAPDTSLTLTPDQVTAAGIGDLQVGDSFSVTITGTVTASDSAMGITADIEGASGGSKTDVTDPDDGAMNPEAPVPPVKKPQSRVVGPKEAGFEE